MKHRQSLVSFSSQRAPHFVCKIRPPSPNCCCCCRCCKRSKGQLELEKNGYQRLRVNKTMVIEPLIGKKDKTRTIIAHNAPQVVTAPTTATTNACASPRRPEVTENTISISDRRIGNVAGDDQHSTTTTTTTTTTTNTHTHTHTHTIHVRIPSLSQGV